MENIFIVLKIQRLSFNLKAALNFRNQCPLHVQINEVDVRVSRHLFRKCFERKMLRQDTELRMATGLLIYKLNVNKSNW
jgi:hypothetical protein